MRRMCIVTITLFCILGLQNVARAECGIQILGASPYGSRTGVVWGKVTGVANTSSFKVVTIIKVGDGWWVKPACNQPFTVIKPDGTWQTDITTGGTDQFAEYIIAYLVPAGMNAGSIPCTTYCQPSGISGYCAYDIFDRNPSRRIVSFAGSRWLVRKCDVPSGPDGNIFSNSVQDVWVDAAGQLHLTITQKGDRWVSTEVIRQGSHGRGVYMIQTNSRLNRNDANSVAGMFTWDPWLCDGAHREIDWEIARWGDPLEPTNSQFVVQPCDQCPECVGQCVRFNVNIRRTDPATVTTYIIWDNQKVEFRSYRGKFTELFPAPEYLIRKWVHKSSTIPKPGKEKFRLNFWLYKANPPLDGKRQEVVFSDFSLHKKALTIDMFSPLGSWPGYVSGIVTAGVVPADYNVEVFIQVNGKWWSKPTFAQPLTSVEPNRTWSTLITTGGQDQSATRIMAFLLPKGKGPHLANGTSDIPAAAYTDAVAWDQVLRK